VDTKIQKEDSSPRRSRIPIDQIGWDTKALPRPSNTWTKYPTRPRSCINTNTATNER